MGKHPHPPRHGASSKKQPASKVPPDDPGSNIIFTNSKDDPKPSTSKKKGGAVPTHPGSTPSSSSNTSKDKGKKEDNPPGAPSDHPKKPDTRTLIAGPSWTGKLPMPLLSEHCQRQKWEKPEYTMHRTPDGFSSTVILRCKNAKTHEVSELPAFKLPPETREVYMRDTAAEARHFAAAYALFRVSSGRNLSMALPPVYRDLWKGEFAERKRRDVEEGKEWMYAADPFAMQREREEMRKKREKINEKVQKDREVRATRSGGAAEQGGAGGQRDMRGWKNVTSIDMGKKTRREVEDVIKKMTVWNQHGAKLPPELRQMVVDELSSLGIRRSHVEEAADICKDKEEILEWLLIHVPEDDLPSWSLPEGYTAGVSLASGNIQREAAVKRLASGGYALELCEEIYDYNNGDEGRAAQQLQNILLKHDDEDLDTLLSQASIDAFEEGLEAWKEEVGVLDSIYEGRIKLFGKDVCEITLSKTLPNRTVTLRLRRPVGRYPLVPPISIITGPLPAHVRLSITRQVLTHVISSQLGEQMIFNMVDWLELEIPRIVEQPGRLTAISGASSVGSVARTPTQKKSSDSSKTKKHLKSLDTVVASQRNLKILAEFERNQNSPAQLKMISARKTLPAWSLQEAVQSLVESHQVTIITGETGSGKSTQCVQFVLDDMIQRKLGSAAKIICTQPRRISALGLADRVAEERCSTVGQEIGYSIRGESRQGPDTRVTFCTTGVLLRRMQTAGDSTTDVIESLATISHVFVDEVHERSLDTDFLLALLRDVLERRKDLKVILMSATLDANVFESYFGGGERVGKAHIEGRAFPVEDKYVDNVVQSIGFNLGSVPTKEAFGAGQGNEVSKTIQSLGMGINFDLIAALVSHIDASLSSQPGAILIFLPGTLEINNTLNALRSNPRLYTLPLHASLLPAEQRRVFPPSPPHKRKVIASTNVAETSITIPDVVAVIDTGRVKETRYHPQTQMVKLEEVWASKAACKQRRGRAGRVRAGSCYKLFTRAAEGKMLERPDPEIRRVPLEQLCLSVKAMGVGDVPGFLKGTLTPPEDHAVEGAIGLLRSMGALDGDMLTALGRNMALIPSDLRCSKLMVYGALFGCLEACVTIATILTLKSPFVAPQEKRDEARTAREAFGQVSGDTIVDMRAYDAWAAIQADSSITNREVRLWCDRNFLSPQTLKDIASTRAQYLSSLKEIGFIPASYTSVSQPDTKLVNGPTASTASTASTAPKQLNRNNYSQPLLQALLLSALHPHTLRILYPSQKYAATSSGSLALDPAAREIRFFDSSNTRAFLHPSSTLFSCQNFPAGGGQQAGFLSYFEKVETSKVFVRGVAPAGTFACLLFGGGVGGVEVDSAGRGVLVDGWIRVRGWARIGVLVGRLRGVLDGVLGRWFEEGKGGLERGDEGVDAGFGEEQDAKVVDLVRRLVEMEGMDR